MGRNHRMDRIQARIFFAWFGCFKANLLSLASFITIFAATSVAGNPHVYFDMRSHVFGP